MLKATLYNHVKNYILYLQIIFSLLIHSLCNLGIYKQILLKSILLKSTCKSFFLTISENVLSIFINYIY